MPTRLRRRTSVGTLSLCPPYSAFADDAHGGPPPVRNLSITLFRNQRLTPPRYEERMGNVILFPLKTEPPEVEIDLYTAVDVAIRDLRDIAQFCDDEFVRQRSDECRRMLEAAYATALANG